DRFLAGRPHVSNVLAAGNGDRSRRRPGGARATSPSAMDDPADGWRGGFGRLSSGWLLAPPPQDAFGSWAYGIRLLVPHRTDRERGAPDRSHQGIGLRSGHKDFHAHIRAWWNGNGAHRGDRSEPTRAACYVRQAD